VDYVNLERVREAVGAARGTFAAADPFPHAVLDGFLRDDVARRLEREFPPPDHRLWKHHLHLHAHKFACNRLDAMPPLFQAVLAELNSPPLIEMLQALTGISGLQPDLELEGGGLHQTIRGGFLKVHADFNCHPHTGSHRRLNLLVYLNPDWREEWNGNLELWDRSMAVCARSILPALNRCVVFATTDTAFHGHPRPLACPESRSRKSLALYYYTTARPAEERSAPHSTLYRRAPGDSRVRQCLQLGRRLLAPGALPHVIRASLGRLRSGAGRRDGHLPR
jgi:hypothetical protein